MSAKSTIKLLQEDFAHFGFPHTVVTDCAATFKSEEFHVLCKENGIVLLTGAPSNPPTNGAAERLVQTFKQALNKLAKAPKDALHDFLRNYRRSPLSTEYSPSELLNLMSNPYQNYTPYCLHVLTLHRANKRKKLPSLNNLSASSP